MRFYLLRKAALIVILGGCLYGAISAVIDPEVHTIGGLRSVESVYSPAILVVGLFLLSVGIWANGFLRGFQKWKVGAKRAMKNLPTDPL